LKDNGDIGGVEQFNWIGLSHSSSLVVLYWEIDSESLEVDHQKEDESGRSQVGKIWKGASQESSLQALQLIRGGKENVEEVNDGSFVFLSEFGGVGDWGE